MGYNFPLFPNIASEKFTGYQNVSLMYKDLQIALNDPTWIGALKNIKAVYVITDTSNGKLYIGSAYGSDGLLNRWNKYITNLTGENKEFEALIKEKGESYIPNNFKYSILEIFDTKTKDEYILERESYWKNVFETKKFYKNIVGFRIKMEYSNNEYNDIRELLKSIITELKSDYRSYIHDRYIIEFINVNKVKELVTL